MCLFVQQRYHRNWPLPRGRRSDYQLAVMCGPRISASCRREGDVAGGAAFPVCRGMDRVAAGKAVVPGARHLTNLDASMYNANGAARCVRRGEAMPMSMIEVRDLTKYYGTVLAVDRVSFQVDSGEVVGFLGLNGAGKTTTMRILTTLLAATSGTARIAGFDVMYQPTPVRRNLGYLPENVPLYSEMRVEEYLYFRAKLKGVDRSVRRSKVEYVLERCHLSGVRRRLIGTLSKGYRQRVGLAEAIVHDPPVLILDEPTAGLDPVQQQETYSLIRELGEKHTVLFSTHILSEVEEVCRRVIVIAQGRISLDRPMHDLRRSNVIVLEARAPADAVRGLLQATEGVEKVSPAGAASDGCIGFEVYARDDRDLRAAIAERFQRQGWLLSRIDLKSRPLREQFLRATLGENADAGN